MTQNLLNPELKHGAIHFATGWLMNCHGLQAVVKDNHVTWGFSPTILESRPEFSDEEIMTIYLFCTNQEQRIPFRLLRVRASGLVK